MPQDRLGLTVSSVPHNAYPLGATPDQRSRGHVEAIRAEQIRLLLRQAPFGLSAVAINAVILVAVMWGEIPQVLLLTWLALTLLLTLARYLLTWAYSRAQPMPSEAARWGFWFVLGAGVSGLTWGVAGALFFTRQSYAHQAFLAFVLAGMSAGGVSTLSSYPGTYPAFLLPALLPYTGRVFAQGGILHTAMGLMLVLFSGLMLAISYRLYFMVRESLKFRFENLDLLTDLAQAKERQEVINRELATEVVERRRAEEEVRRSEQRLVLHVQKTPFAVIEWDPAFHVVAWNPAAERIFGYAASEARGQRAVDLIVPEDVRERTGAVWEDVLSGGEATCHIIHNVTKDGRGIVCEWYNTRLVDDQGEIMGVASLAQDVTDRTRTEAELQEREALVQAVIDSLPASVAVLDRAGAIIRVNHAWQRCADRDGDPLLQGVGVGTDYLSACRRAVVRDGTAKQALDSIEAVLRGVEMELTVEYPRPGPADTQWFMVSVSALKSARGGAVIAHLNITQRKQAEERLLLAAVFENTNEGILLLDARGRIVAVNRAFTGTTGYSRKEVLLKSPDMLVSDRHGRAFYRQVWRSLRTGGQWQGEIWGRRKNGESYAAWLGCNAVRDDVGATSNYVVVFSDITRLKQGEEHLYQLAYNDTLTGLPNRMLFRERLQHALLQAGRSGSRVALLYLDLDRFKFINDSLGHDVGDRLLKEVAVRLAASVRESDTVARLGGDEFTVMIEQIELSEDAAVVAQKIVHGLSQPYSVEGHEIYTSVSIGISVFPEDADAAPVLLKNADTAMYRAKEQGRARYQFYSAEMDAYARDRMWLDVNLRRALERRELELHYQLLMSVTQGVPTKVEALLRWHHPERGWISPAEFIPLAEDTGLITSISEWVLREGCEKSSAWRAAGLTGLVLAVNLSAHQLRQQSLVALVARVLEDTGLDPSRLELELTETQLMQNAAAAIAVLEELKALGVRIAMDDFGTGYSSLSYLRRFPLDAVKIDRSFIASITSDPADAAIAQAVIAMAHTLGLEVVAEGVETAEQLALLRNWQCDTAQGYYFSSPMTSDDMARFLIQGDWETRRAPIAGDDDRGEGYPAGGLA
jgi:diguanylate cyclase (GGDEF)-like protein/PAS domain S-box-containing protein